MSFGCTYMWMHTACVYEFLSLFLVCINCLGILTTIPWQRKKWSGLIVTRTGKNIDDKWYWREFHKKNLKEKKNKKKTNVRVHLLVSFYQVGINTVSHICLLIHCSFYPSHQVQFWWNFILKWCMHASVKAHKLGLGFLTLIFQNDLDLTTLNLPIYLWH